MRSRIAKHAFAGAVDHIAGMNLTANSFQALQLLRLTTLFDPQEDRLRLQAEVAGGGVVVLRMTQRLLNRLVPHLCAWLERSAPDVSTVLDRPWAPDTQAGSAGSESNAESKDSEPMGQCAEAEKAVSFQSVVDQESWLIAAVDIDRTECALVLSFRASERSPVRIELSPQPLRQWLEIVLRQYWVAEWPLQAWPSWLLASPKVTPVLH